MLKAIITTFAVATLLPLWALPQEPVKPLQVSYCEVVASPADYNGKTLSVEVILSPGFHSLFLYPQSCPRRDDIDATTEAVLPNSWVSLPNEKKLRGILKHGGHAKVTVIGTFEGSGEKRYGLEGQRFRFSVSQIDSVSKVAAPMRESQGQ